MRVCEHPHPVPFARFCYSTNRAQHLKSPQGRYTPSHSMARLQIAQSQPIAHLCPTTLARPQNWSPQSEDHTPCPPAPLRDTTHTNTRTARITHRAYCNTVAYPYRVVRPKRSHWADVSRVRTACRSQQTTHWDSDPPFAKTDTRPCPAQTARKNPPQASPKSVDHPPYPRPLCALATYPSAQTPRHPPHW